MSKAKGWDARPGCQDWVLLLPWVIFRSKRFGTAFPLVSIRVAAAVLKNSSKGLRWRIRQLRCPFGSMLGPMSFLSPWSPTLGSPGGAALQDGPAGADTSSAGVSGSAAGSSMLPSSLLSSTVGRGPQAAALLTWTWHQLLNAAVVAVTGSASVTPPACTGTVRICRAQLQLCCAPEVAGFPAIPVFLGTLPGPFYPSNEFAAPCRGESGASCSPLSPSCPGSMGGLIPPSSHVPHCWGRSSAIGLGSMGATAALIDA